MCITCVRYAVYNVEDKEELLLNLKGWKKNLRNMRVMICKAVMLNNDVLLYSITTSQQDEQKLATLNNTAAFMILKLILNHPPKALYCR